MPWTTPAEVLAMTGEEVAVTDVALASAMVDSKAGTSEDLPEDAMIERDRVRLKKATIWQAVWVKDKPGLLSAREAVTQTSAAGSSQSRKNVSSIMYSPMALLELEGLSWRGTRTVVVPPRVAAFQQVSFLNEASDACGVWTPL